MHGSLFWMTMIFANHFLIRRGLGIFYIPEDKTEEFKKYLIDFYETGAKTRIMEFLKAQCVLEI